MPDGQSDFVNFADRAAPARTTRPLSVRHARTLEDMMKIAAIRAAVYMAEQDCPYEEEFDGNDFCGSHLIGYVGNEPVACLRIRYFGEFAKIERVAVRPAYRKTRIAFKLVRAGLDHCHRKGFRKVLGHARDELIPLYKMFGCKVMENGRQFIFSDYCYTEMVHEAPLPENAITLDTDPYHLIRPEGDWDRPGILEESADRESRGQRYQMAAE